MIDPEYACGRRIICNLDIGGIAGLSAHDNGTVESHPRLRLRVMTHTGPKPDGRPLRCDGEGVLDVVRRRAPRAVRQGRRCTGRVDIDVLRHDRHVIRACFAQGHARDPDCDSVGPRFRIDVRHIPLDRRQFRPVAEIPDVLRALPGIHGSTDKGNRLADKDLSNARSVEIHVRISPRIKLIRADILRNADFPCRRSRDVERRHGLGIIPICRCVNGFGSARQPIVTAKGIDKSRILSRQV